MKIHSLLFLPVLCLTSCATITRGVHEKLSVTSDPSGANVTLSTGEKGMTPAKFVKERRTDSFTVTVSKPGYIPQTVKVESKLGGTGGGAMAGNLLLGGAIGMGVDAGTGAYKSLYPNPVAVHLAATSTSKSKAPKKSATKTPEEKPQTKPKSTKPSASVETTPKTETITTRPESTPIPASTSTPYVPPTLETSPSP